MSHQRIALCAALCLYSLQCGGPAEGQREDGKKAASAVEKIVGTEEKFAHGERAFQQVRESLRKRYFRDLSDDEIYGAAVRGLLEHLEPDGKGPWNVLLSPSEIAEMRADMLGEVVGIGVEIKLDEASGITDVIGVLPGSPAAQAGVREGDKILTIDGKRYQGQGLRDVVVAIRGKAGEELRLLILRGADLVTLKLRRARVPFDVVSHRALPEGVAYLQIKAFSEGTPAALKQALQKIGPARALILDLRGNQGGLLEKAIACADLLLPKGTTIVRVPKRGAKDEIFVAKGGPALAPMPVSVLVGSDTASGAELLAAALREGRAATVVGQKTFGKWSVQTVEDLDNGYAVKYTLGFFRTAAGKSYEGEGLVPDVEVSMDTKEVTRLQRLSDVAVRLQRDVALRTAHSLLRLQVR